MAMDLFSFQSPRLEEKAIHDMHREMERIEEKAEPRHGADTPELEQMEKGMLKDDVAAEVIFQRMRSIIGNFAYYSTRLPLTSLCHGPTTSILSGSLLATT